MGVVLSTRLSLSILKHTEDSRETSTLLKTPEIAEAQNYWFRYAQTDAFGGEDKDVMKLNAQKDQHGIYYRTILDIQ